VVLLIAFGRLPALAWKGSILVRFGSLWDDPNGFAMVIPLLMGFAYYRYSGVYRWTVLALLALMLLGTFSITGCLSLALAVLLGAAMVLLRSIAWVRKRDRNMAIALCAALLLAGIVLFALQEYVHMVLEAKSGSIEDHMEDYWRMLASYTPGSIVGAELIKPGEPGWLNLFADLGVVYFLCFLSVTAVSMVRWFMLWTGAEGSDRTMRPLAAGFFMFTAACAVGMSNLPVEDIFPVNLILAAGIALAIHFGKEGVPAPSMEEGLR